MSQLFSFGLGEGVWDIHAEGGTSPWQAAAQGRGGQVAPCFDGSWLLAWFLFFHVYLPCSSDDLALLLLLLLFLWWPGFVTPVTPVTLVTCLWPCSSDDLALLSLFLWWPFTVLVLTCPSHPPRPQSEKLVQYIRTNVYCEDRPLHIYVKTKVGKCCDVWCLLTLGCRWWLPLYGIKIRGIHFKYWNNEQ
jgi:hypothetical protein